MFLKLFSLWLILLPFIICNGAYEGPKIIYYLVGSFVLFVFWITRVLKEKKDFEFVKSDYLFLLWLIVLLVSSSFGIHPMESILGGSYRHQGVIFFLALWLIGKTVGILKSSEKEFLMKGIGVGVLIQAIIVIFQFLSGQLYFGKSLGTLGEANAVAGFLAIGSYFVYRAFPNLFLILPALAIILESSRSGILSFVPNTFPFFTLMTKKSKIINFTLVLVVAALLLFSISLTKGPSVFEDRLLFWKLGIKEIMHNPVLGFGAESGEVVYDSAFNQIGIPLKGLMIDRAHNLFLDIAMWSGIVGLIIFCLWLYQNFKDVGDIGKKAALLSFLVYSMFQPLSIVHWVLLIVIINSSDKSKEEGGRYRIDF